MHTDSSHVPSSQQGQVFCAGWPWPTPLVRAAAAASPGQVRITIRLQPGSPSTAVRTDRGSTSRWGCRGWVNRVGGRGRQRHHLDECMHPPHPPAPAPPRWLQSRTLIAIQAPTLIGTRWLQVRCQCVCVHTHRDPTFPPGWCWGRDRLGMGGRQSVLCRAELGGAVVWASLEVRHG